MIQTLSSARAWLADKLATRPGIRMLFAAALVPGVLAGAFLSFGIYETERAQLDRGALQTARALMRAVDSEFAKIAAAALTLSRSEYLTRNDLPSFYSQAQEVLAVTGAGNNYVLSDIEGQQLLNTARPYATPLPKHGNLDQLRRVVQSRQMAISDIYIGAVLGKPLLSIDVPVLRDGKPIYVLSVGILPEYFNRLLAEQQLPAGWVATLLDTQGTVAARNLAPEQTVGKRATPDLLARLRASAEGAIASRTLEGKPSFIAYSKSASTHWALATGATRDVLYSNLYQPMALAGLAMLICLLCGALLAWAFSRHVRQALQALDAAAQAARLGDRDARAPVNGIHEISVLAEQFNRMQEARKTAEDALRQSEEELRQAQRIARLGSWRLDLASERVTWSKELFEMYGLDPALGPPPFDQHGRLFAPASWRRLTDAVTTTKATGVAYELELETVRSDGRQGWVWVRGELMRDASGNAVALRGIAQDITERKAVESELEGHRLHLEQLVASRTLDLATAKEAAEAANRAKSTFLANMSHELRTPMNAIMGMTDIVMRHLSEPRQIEQMKKVKTASAHLLGLINDILDISRIEAERLTLEHVDFNLGQVVEDLLRLVSHKAADKQLALRVDLPADLACLMLRGDPLRLGQILLNLTGNAVKFTERGGIALHIRLIQDTSTAVQLRFEVQDTGIGISAAHQRRLFTAFEQGDASMTRKYGGTGLGLAISRRLASMMGGDMGVQSEEGRGSTFWFTVRLDKAGSAVPPPGVRATESP